jgi:hypothetical protein
MGDDDEDGSLWWWSLRSDCFLCLKMLIRLRDHLEDVAAVMMATTNIDMSSLE